MIKPLEGFQDAWSSTSVISSTSRGKRFAEVVRRDRSVDVLFVLPSPEFVYVWRGAKYVLHLIATPRPFGGTVCLLACVIHNCATKP